LPKLIESINKYGQNIEIQVQQQSNRLPETAIEEEEIDVVIVFDAIFKLPSYIRHEKLFDDKIVCITRREHQSITGNEVSFEQFIASGHMLISPTGTGTGLVDDYLAARGMARKISLVIPNFLPAPWIVANTDLVLSLQILPIPIDLPIYNLIMIWHPRQEKEPAHQWLRREILKVCCKMTRKLTKPIGPAR
jgi:DNA-binding transcriptional LysR family regulator